MFLRRQASAYPNIATEEMAPKSPYWQPSSVRECSWSGRKSILLNIATDEGELLKLLGGWVWNWELACSSPNFNELKTTLTPNKNGSYHSTFKTTYSGFILGELNFVIISAKITGKNSLGNYFVIQPGRMASHTRGGSYAIVLGPYAICSVEIPWFLGTFMPNGPPFYRIFSGASFFVMWGVEVVRISFRIGGGRLGLIRDHEHKMIVRGGVGQLFLHGPLHVRMDEAILNSHARSSESTGWRAFGEGSCLNSFHVWTILPAKCTTKSRRPPDYSSNLCPPETFAIWPFVGCFGPLSCCFSYTKGPNDPLKKSYSKCLRRTQIRWVIWRASKIPILTPPHPTKTFRAETTLLKTHLHKAIVVCQILDMIAKGAGAGEQKCPLQRMIFWKSLCVCLHCPQFCACSGSVWSVCPLKTLPTSLRPLPQCQYLIGKNDVP